MRLIFYKNALITLGLASLLSACGGSNSDTAQLRVLHASPDAPAVDVLIDGGGVLEGLSFGDASPFTGVDAGHRQIQVNVSGTDTTVIDARADLEEDKRYLVVASGRVSDLQPLVFPVSAENSVAGSALVRVLHAAPSAPRVDVYVVAAGTSIAQAAPALSDVPFRAISDYLPVPEGSYDLLVTPAGTKNIAIEAKNVTLTDGLIATVAALDASGGGAPFTLAILAE